MDISVVLATYNRAASLRITLESFASLSIPPTLDWELLVVDNNSTDDTSAAVNRLIDRMGARVRYLFEGRQGRSAALNAGIAQAKGEIIAFTDDDIILDPNWLTEIHAAFKDSSVSAVAGRIFPLWEHAQPKWLEMNGQQAVVNFDLGDEPQTIQIAPMGANSAFRREVFSKYGLFRLDLGVRGSKHTITCDDTEFGGRLMAAGEKIAYCPAAVIHHPVDPTRTTKKYFLTWYFYNGVSLTRTGGLPTEGVFYFGVPRWLYGRLLRDVGNWFATLNPERRFQSKLKACRSVGQIVECFRLSRGKTKLGPQLAAS
jgi:glucosyl-dolichyl phosphate glucuronosyltransferase